MAAYYPYVLVTLLLIYLHSTNAKDSVYNGRKDQIEAHLLQEKQTPSPPQTSDWVCEQNNYGKKSLCNEVFGHLIHEVKRHTLEALLDEVDIQEPQMVDMDSALVCRNVFVKGPDMFMPMYWCRSRRYRKKASQSASTSASNIDQIRGFFCAGSLLDSERVYVFRPKDKKTSKVDPVAELNGCKLGEDVPTTEWTWDDVSTYRYGHESLVPK